MIDDPPAGSDWFPVRITEALGDNKYLFVEVWTTPDTSPAGTEPGGVIADRAGNRFNTDLDPAYAIDGSTFEVTAAGSAVQAFARRSPGAGGLAWELKGFASGRKLFAALVSEVAAPDSWQSRTLTSGAWANDDAFGTNNAYPVQIYSDVAGGYESFPTRAGAPSLMWEEPPGSGVYAFLPIQYASGSSPGFVSGGEQTFGGYKKFEVIGLLESSGAATAFLANIGSVVTAYSTTDPRGHGSFGVKGSAGEFAGIDANISIGGFTYIFKGGLLVAAS